MSISIIAAAVAFGLAFLAGFASHRGSLCAVKAVDEILRQRRARTAASFVRAALWALLVAGLLSALWPSERMEIARYQASWLGAAGAIAFGFGAAINGACALSTFSRLATGEAAKLMTVLGFVGGASLAALAFTRGMLPMPEPMLTPLPAFGIPGWLIMTLLAMALTADLVFASRRIFARAGWRGILLARRHAPVLAAALLGISGGALAWLIGPWTYTALARHFGFALAGIEAAGMFSWIVLLLALALALGTLCSCALRGGWRFVWGRPRNWLTGFLGGVAMGFGLATIPGGNDELLLVSIATLSPHALPSYALIVLSIALVLWLQKRMR